jgi:Protein of unknown function (DUF3631)
MVAEAVPTAPRYTGPKFWELEEDELEIPLPRLTPITPPQPEPYVPKGEPVAPLEGLADVLDRVAATLQRFIHFTTIEQVWAVTLWAAHTHLITNCDVSPRLSVRAPTRGSGKTRLLEIIELLSQNGWLVLNPSAAVIYRSIQRRQPTILFDEADRYFEKRDEDTADITQVINGGYRRGASVPRCQGPKQDLVDFPTFSAVALAGIGNKWPDTVLDRSIVIDMQKKTRDEPVDRFQRDERAIVAVLGTELGEALAAISGELTSADLPDELGDRAQEHWEPLIAIAHHAGSDWPEHAFQAAVALSAKGIQIEDDRFEVQALRDVRRAFANQADEDPAFLPTSTIIDYLKKIADSPWGDDLRPLNAHRLGRHLGKFHIKSIQLHRGGPRGYALSEVADQWHRIGNGQEVPRD